MHAPLRTQTQTNPTTNRYKKTAACQTAMPVHTFRRREKKREIERIVGREGEGGALVSKGKFLVPWRAADLKTNRNDTRSAFKDLNLNTHIHQSLMMCRTREYVYLVLHTEPL